MNNKGIGDFGGVNGIPRQDSGMGDWWSDQVKKLEKGVQNIGTGFEEQARNVVQANTSWLPPEMRAEAERLIAEAGGKMGEDLKAQLQAKAKAMLIKEAKNQLNDPNNQNMAIQAGILGASKKISQWVISVKDSLLNGTIYKTHPVFTGVAVGVPSLVFVKFMIGKKRTKVVYAQQKPKAKANPRKKRKLNKKR